MHVPGLKVAAGWRPARDLQNASDRFEANRLVCERAAAFTAHDCLAYIHDGNLAFRLRIEHLQTHSIRDARSAAHGEWRRTCPGASRLRRTTAPLCSRAASAPLEDEPIAHHGLRRNLPLPPYIKSGRFTDGRCQRKAETSCRIGPARRIIRPWEER